eukprot:59824-Amorphochlora_amoeboformis.AAC.1
MVNRKLDETWSGVAWRDESLRGTMLGDSRGSRVSGEDVAGWELTGEAVRGVEVKGEAVTGLKDGCKVEGWGVGDDVVGVDETKS